MPEVETDEGDGGERAADELTETEVELDPEDVKIETLEEVAMTEVATDEEEAEVELLETGTIDVCDVKATEVDSVIEAASVLIVWGLLVPKLVEKLEGKVLDVVLDELALLLQSSQGRGSAIGQKKDLNIIATPTRGGCPIACWTVIVKIRASADRSRPLSLGEVAQAGS